MRRAAKKARVNGRKQKKNQSAPRMKKRSKSLIKKDIDAIETTGEQLKEIDLKLEGVWKGLQMLK